MRSFQWRFNLAEHIQVVGATLADGLLTIELKRELPEAMRPRRIEIATGGTVQRPQPIKGQHPGARRLKDDTFRALFRLFKEGKIRPLVHAVYPLEQYREALDIIAGRGVMGKIVLAPGLAPSDDVRGAPSDSLR